ncbi:carbohydrate ABC transporter substrate-binding protein (CUT1 family) [Haloactinopolyspora alba]|uniref:Carbohydrate ABC transporter substrate-binding protein (CUT1 family) n=1 Tax=Haloactinopolyspora alba TaxID=648780 RepID=A0A2P8EG89_9ACTN|nr:ABC transporter substrate-binding protein [Haloactinopolyspora alba]PSL08488.1 carbohydrate ABC transporter substrate-binding protein (CUT1 family) [Haloactinopolyspora alba]
MSTSDISRRGFLAGTAAIGLSGILGGCVGSGGSTDGGGGGGDASPSGPITLQSSAADPKPKAALKAVVDAFQGAETTINTVAVENFRAQLPTYLTSSNPPDVLTWYAGSVARDYASEGLLLDVSDLWEGDGACAGFSDALRDLSSTEDGSQIFVPTHYYWWGVFHRTSAFDEWGVQAPETWEDFLALCEMLRGRGIVPLTMGTGSTPWVASGWFDYLNLRINGPEYHLELLSGEHSFDSAEVRAVMTEYAKLIPFIDPNGRSYSWQEAVTPLVQNEAAMYLMGAFFTQSVPSDVVDDIDFFRVPIIDESLPVAEEAPTDGYFAASGTDNAAGAKELMSHLAAPDSQQTYVSKAGGAYLPTSPEVDTSGFSPMVQKGIQLLEESDRLTQFFNRDSSDELQTTADAALTRFLDQPDQVDDILSQWQQAAEQVFQA